MKVLNLEQGSQAWHDFRNGVSEHGLVLTASKIASIMGENPYKASHTQFAEDVGIKAIPDLSGNPHVRRGNEAEPFIQAWVDNEVGAKGEPIVAISDRYPFLGASYDWLNMRKGIWEIKSPAIKAWERAKKQGIPPHYVSQLDGQIIVSDGEFHSARLIIWHPDVEPGGVCPKGMEPLIFERFLTQEREEEIVRKVKAYLDDVAAYIGGDESRLWEKSSQEAAFARRYKAGADPKVMFPMSDLTGDALAKWTDAANTASFLQAQIAARESEVKALKKDYEASLKEMVSLMTGFETAEDAQRGIRISKYLATGTVDWKALASEMVQGEITTEMEDKFRRKSSERIRATFPKPD